jgi:hypothetical protein
MLYVISVLAPVRGTVPYSSSEKRAESDPGTSGMIVRRVLHNPTCLVSRGIENQAI